jgi:predicted RNase H-like nuclease (RuvC/YqgF family)
MKASAKRRRGKAEIKEQRRADVQKQSEIVQKLARIEELERGYQQLKSSAQRV